MARGLMEWAYAAALGPRDGLSIDAADAASRHDLGIRAPGGRANVWRPPMAGSDASAQRWRVLGPLLSLDVVLADFSLVSLSSKPPSRRPTLGEIDRRVFVDTIALVEPRSLVDSDRDAIAAAIRQGRARLASARSPVEVSAIADAAGLSPLRRTLFSWTTAHDPARVSAFLSPGELFWLGAGDTKFTSLNAWGVPALSRAGCLCLEVVAGRPPEIFAGRWNAGMAASAFPDLNLRLAELLSDLHMPAALLAPVLTSATLDFVNSAISRDEDDRRGLVEFVQGLPGDTRRTVSGAAHDRRAAGAGRRGAAGKGSGRLEHAGTPGGGDDAALVGGVCAAASRGRSPSAPGRRRRLQITSPGRGHRRQRPDAARGRGRAASTRSRPVKSVTFSVDGRLACTVEKPPFGCTWDPGDVVARPSYPRRRRPRRRPPPDRQRAHEGSSASPSSVRTDAVLVPVDRDARRAVRPRPEAAGLRDRRGRRQAVDRQHGRARTRRSISCSRSTSAAAWSTRSTR